MRCSNMGIDKDKGAYQSYGKETRYKWDLKIDLKMSTDVDDFT